MSHITESHRALSPKNVTSDAAPCSYTGHGRWTSPLFDTQAFGVLLSVLLVMWAALLYSGVASVLHDIHMSHSMRATAVAALAIERHPCENAAQTVSDQLQTLSELFEVKLGQAL